MSPKQSTLWVMDDDAAVRQYLADRIVSRGYQVVYLDSGKEVLERLDISSPPSLILLDILMRGGSGLALLAKLQQVGCRIPSIVLSPVAQVPTVVQAMKLGASDYLLKPVQGADLERAISRLLQGGPEPLLAKKRAFDLGLQTSNERMLRILDICDRVAPLDVPVLILGESGVGKEVVSRYIHARSELGAPFIKVNCAAVPADLLESELFGHERGAFTGAQREKPGKFEIAGRGIIMLDEIGELNAGLQAKLLHVLHDGEYSRVGGVRSLRSEARIIAATNRDLKKLVATGEFREDLYFRLNVINIEIPPLRDRREDIPHLCDLFVQRYRSKYGSEIMELPSDLIRAFVNYSWPGNVRQLENCVKRFLILRDVDQAIADVEEKNVKAVHCLPISERVSLKELASNAAEQTERELVFRTLNQLNWNRKKAARQLGICYKSLLNKLHRWQNEMQGEVAMGGSRSDTPRSGGAVNNPRLTA